MDGREIQYSAGKRANAARRADVLEAAWRMGGHVYELRCHAYPPAAGSPEKRDPHWRQYALAIDSREFSELPQIFDLGLKGFRPAKWGPPASIGGGALSVVSGVSSHGTHQPQVQRAVQARIEEQRRLLGRRQAATDESSRNLMSFSSNSAGREADRRSSLTSAPPSELTGVTSVAPSELTAARRPSLASTTASEHTGVTSPAPSELAAAQNRARGTSLSSGATVASDLTSDPGSVVVARLKDARQAQRPPMPPPPPTSQYQIRVKPGLDQANHTNQREPNNTLVTCQPQLCQMQAQETEIPWSGSMGPRQIEKSQVTARENQHQIRAKTNDRNHHQPEPALVTHPSPPQHQIQAHQNPLSAIEEPRQPEKAVATALDNQYKIRVKQITSKKKDGNHHQPEFALVTHQPPQHLIQTQATPNPQNACVELHQTERLQATTHDYHTQSSTKQQPLDQYQIRDTQSQDQVHHQLQNILLNDPPLQHQTHSIKDPGQPEKLQGIAQGYLARSSTAFVPQLPPTYKEIVGVAYDATDKDKSSSSRAGDASVGEGTMASRDGARESSLVPWASDYRELEGADHVRAAAGDGASGNTRMLVTQDLSRHIKPTKPRIVSSSVDEGGVNRWGYF